MDGMSMLMKAFGIDPEAIQAQMKELVNEFVSAVKALDARVAVVEKQNAQMNRKLDAILEALRIPAPEGKQELVASIPPQHVNGGTQ